jgi:hypothetical protein
VAHRDKRPFSVHHGDRWACRLLCLHLVAQSLLAMLVSSPTAPHLHLHFSCKYHSLTESYSDALLLMKLFLSSAKICDFLDCDFHWTTSQIAWKPDATITKFMSFNALLM